MYACTMAQVLIVPRARLYVYFKCLQWVPSGYLYWATNMYTWGLVQTCSTLSRFGLISFSTYQIHSKELARQAKLKVAKGKILHQTMEYSWTNCEPLLINRGTAAGLICDGKMTASEVCLDCVLNRKTSLGASATNRKNVMRVGLKRVPLSREDKESPAPKRGKVLQIDLCHTVFKQMTSYLRDVYSHVDKVIIATAQLNQFYTIVKCFHTLTNRCTGVNILQDCTVAY